MKKLCQVSSPKFKLPANGDEMKDDASLVVKNMAELTKVPIKVHVYLQTYTLLVFFSLKIVFIRI